MMPGLGGGAASPGAVTAVPASLTYNASYAGGTVTAAIGTAATDRYVVIGITSTRGAGNAVEAHSSVSIGGVSCTKIVDATQQDAFAGNSYRTTLWISNSPVTTGTTATLSYSVGTHGTVQRTVVYSLYGINSTTPFDTVSATGSATVSGSIDYPENGVLISVAMPASVNSGGPTSTWTGATEDYDGGGTWRVTSASKASLTSQTSQTISVVATTQYSTAGGTLVAATWSPA